MSLSLSKKLILGGVVLVALPIVILGWFAYETASDGLVKQARQSAQIVAQRVADMTQVAMSDQVDIAKEVAAGNTVTKLAIQIDQAGGKVDAAAAAELNDRLSKVLAALGGNYENIALIDAKGVVVGDAKNGKDKGINVSSRPYFQEAIGGKVSVGIVVRSKASGNPVAIIAAPVKAGGKVVGSVLLLLKTEFLSKKITGFRLGETGYAWMANKQGLFVAHPKPDFILNKDLQISKLDGMETVARRMMAGETGVEQYVFKGSDKTCGFAAVPLTGWSVAFTQNDDEFLSAVYDIRNGVGLIGIIALALAILALIFFARSITRPINRVVKGLDRASQQVGTAAGQVASSSQQLAEGASEQAASIEETSASLEEITSMTKRNADNAAEANQLTKSANKMVGEASNVMGELTHSMQEISAASDETSKIIKTIDEIAFQTNLLALNAAVEAARAGEAGAGFAVVADEVRNLAMRAAEAAKNTQALIENTVHRVHSGGELVGRADESFHRVLESTTKVAELVEEIAVASREQAQGVDQINLAVSEMDKVTQTVAANAEESAASSEEMNGQAESMHGFVGELMKVVSGRTDRIAGGADRSRSIKDDKPRTALLTAPRSASIKARPVMSRAAEEAIPFGDDFENF